jgi:hypothetical protein
VTASYPFEVWRKSAKAALQCSIINRKRQLGQRKIWRSDKKISKGLNASMGLSDVFRLVWNSLWRGLTGMTVAEYEV